MEPFTQSVIRIVQSIPEGKVMTYGQIARHAGSPRGARQVVRILHSQSRKQGLPWQRVVNAKGEIALPEGEARYSQLHLLEEEGVKWAGSGRVDLAQCLYEPEIEQGRDTRFDWEPRAESGTGTETGAGAIWA